MNKEDNSQEKENVNNGIDRSDWLLAQLVNMCNQYDGVTFEITLNIGGMLVSGKLIGGKQYFEEFANMFSKGGLPEIGNAFREGKKLYDTEEKYEHKELPQPQYIHLSDTQLFHPAGKPIPTNQKVLWRGRLDAVDGFIMGSLKSTD